MKIKFYQDLIAWQKAMDLVEDVYKASRDFPREETYALTSQVRRGRRFNRIKHLKAREGGQHQIFSDGCPLHTVRCLKLKPKC